MLAAKDEAAAFAAAHRLPLDSLHVVCAAVKVGTTVYALPRPARHHNVLWFMGGRGVPPRPADQGFLLSDGRFVLRKPAARVRALQERLLEQERLAHAPHKLPPVLISLLRPDPPTEPDRRERPAGPPKQSQRQRRRDARRGGRG